MSRVMNWVKVPRNKVVCWSVLITLIVPWVFPLFHISTADPGRGSVHSHRHAQCLVDRPRRFDRHHLSLVVAVRSCQCCLPPWSFCVIKWYAYFFAPVYLLLGLSRRWQRTSILYRESL